jgi:hypothetical protein
LRLFRRHGHKIKRGWPPPIPDQTAEFNYHGSSISKFVFTLMMSRFRVCVIPEKSCGRCAKERAFQDVAILPIPAGPWSLPQYMKVLRTPTSESDLSDFHVIRQGFNPPNRRSNRHVFCVKPSFRAKVALESNLLSITMTLDVRVIDHLIKLIMANYPAQRS